MHIIRLCKNSNNIYILVEIALEDDDTLNKWLIGTNLFFSALLSNKFMQSSHSIRMSLNPCKGMLSTALNDHTNTYQRHNLQIQCF